MAFFFGFKINDDFDEQQNILDLQEGSFVTEQPVHPFFIEGENALLTSQLLRVLQPFELASFKLNHATRRQLLKHYHDYYALHIPDFGELKTMAILGEVL